MLNKKEIVLDVLRFNGLDLQYVNGALKDDLDVIKTAIYSNPEAIQYVRTNIPEELILDAFARIKSKIEKDCKKFRLQTDDVLRFAGLYHYTLLNIYRITNKVKENLPEYFNDANFMLKLVDIDQELQKFASAEVQSNKAFLDATRDYVSPTTFEVFDMYVQKTK